MADKTLRNIRIALWLAIPLVSGAAIFALTQQDEPPAEQVSYGETVGGPFELIAPDGSIVTDETLAGKPYAIFFGFTRCPDVCPTTLARLARWRQAMGDDGDKFEIVFVSVDAGRDTPEDIGRYVELFKTPIIGLTGNQEQVDRIVKAWHAYAARVPVEGGDYTIDHTAGVFLMDAGGRLQSIIDHHEQEPAALAKLNQLIS